MAEITLDRSTRRASAFTVLGAVSLCHLLNDLMQSLVIASYPILKGEFGLSFGQIGLLTLTYQITASVLQPLVGIYTDRAPQPYSLPAGMASSLLGLLLLAFAPSYVVLLAGAALLGIGSSIFHPESSRLARFAARGALGLAQSVFQVGGNVGSSLGPLLVAFWVLPRGRQSLAWFALVALGGIIILTAVGSWYRRKGHAGPASRGSTSTASGFTRREIGGALVVLFCLMLSKWFYLASFTSYYVFYLMERFAVPEEHAQIYLFVFLAAVAAGTLAGGPVGDRIGRKAVIWGSIAGVLPFTLVLPYVGLAATVALSIVIALVLSSAFSAIVVYAQELMPSRVGMVSGLFFGLAFGMGGLGAAVLGVLADWTNIEFVYRLCGFLPAIGVLAASLPDSRRNGAQ
jgi:FSR family fosmidomycin resistance protein-like MFS transporter